MSTKPSSGVISVNEKKQSIQIHDQYSRRLTLQRIFYILLVASALYEILHLASGYQTSRFGWLYIITGFVAVPFLIHYLQKRTSVPEIPFAHISGISKKTFWGSGVFHIHLINNKTREIHKSLSRQDIDFLRELLEENGVPMSRQDASAFEIGEK